MELELDVLGVVAELVKDIP
jgi:hypothetical protein